MSEEERGLMEGMKWQIEAHRFAIASAVTSVADPRMSAAVIRNLRLLEAEALKLGEAPIPFLEELRSVRRLIRRLRRPIRQPR